MRERLAAELCGTFFLVFGGCGAVAMDSVAGGLGPIGVSLAFGLVVMVVIYAIGDVSGAHINPAVTIGFWAAGRFPGKWVLPYVATHCAAAILGAWAVRAAYGDEAALGLTLPRNDLVLMGFFVEVGLTFALMFVILSVSTGAKEKGITAGIAIGGMIALEALMAGGLTGASMNPARSLGPAVADQNFQHLWLYLTAPVAGAVASVPIFRLTRGGPDPVPDKSL